MELPQSCLGGGFDPRLAQSFWFAVRAMKASYITDWAHCESAFCFFVPGESAALTCGAEASLGYERRRV